MQVLSGLWVDDTVGSRANKGGGGGKKRAPTPGDVDAAKRVRCSSAGAGMDAGADADAAVDDTAGAAAGCGAAVDVVAEAAPAGTAHKSVGLQGRRMNLGGFTGDKPADWATAHTPDKLVATRVSGFRGDGRWVGMDVRVDGSCSVLFGTTETGHLFVARDAAKL